MMKVLCTKPQRLDCRQRPGANPWRIVAMVFAHAASALTIAAAEDRADIEPDAAVQATIAQVAEADNGAGQQAAIERLVKLDETSREQLVRQLVYFASRARDTREAMTAGVVIRRLDVPDDAIARALAPCLGTADAAVAKSVRNVLNGLENRAPGRRPDFSVYRGIIEERVRGGEPLPVELIRYMYDADVGMAMLTMMRAHQLRAPEKIKTILWAEHVVSDVLWKQQYGFLAANEVEPAASRELASLATHEAWWARMYVAEIMRQHAAFRQADLTDTLRRDVNELVRKSAESAQTAP